jgi:hypothetical protein
MANAWITHVKQYASANNLSYACALSTPACREAYRPPVNYRPELNRIAKMLQNKRGQPPTAAKIQQARDAWNQIRVPILALPDSDRKEGYEASLRAIRIRIRSLIT